jgi:hypothetical protein
VTSTEDVTAFFPIILIQDYNNASFIQGLFPGEIFIIFFGVLIYLLTTVFTLFHLGKHIAAWLQDDKTRSFLSLSRVALMVLALVLLSKFSLAKLGNILANAVQTCSSTRVLIALTFRCT